MKTKNSLIGVLEAEGVYIDPLTLDLKVSTTELFPHNEDTYSNEDYNIKKSQAHYNSYRFRSNADPQTRLPFSPVIFKHAEIVKDTFESEIVSMVAGMQVGMDFGWFRSRFRSCFCSRCCRAITGHERSANHSNLDQGYFCPNIATCRSFSNYVALFEIFF